MNDFLNKILTDIINGVDLPRVQVERQITPFLDPFIERIINSCKKPETYKLVGAEFPIEARDNNGMNLSSSSIDYLLVTKDQSKLLIVELKTDSNSFKHAQFENYDNTIKRINIQRASFLYEFLCSLEHKKFKHYRELIDKRIPNTQWQEIKQCGLVYIAPEKMISRKWGSKNAEAINEIEFLHFSDMPAEISGEFASEWELVKNALVKLDAN